MAKRQEAKSAPAADSPGDAADSSGKTLKVEAKESAQPSIDSAKKDVPLTERQSQTGKETGDGSVAAVSKPRFSRFAQLAAAAALAAAVGSIAGSLSASGLAHLLPGSVANSNMAEANALQSIKAKLAELSAIKAELAELSGLKANLDSATRGANSQFAKLADRLDRVERAQIEPVTKIEHIAEMVDRLGKREPAAPETTGSVANSPPSVQPPAATELKGPDKILQDWVVQDVRGGHALVASRYGGVFEVAAGAVLPGLGRVETIKRQDGQWVVVTGHGLITEH